MSTEDRIARLENAIDNIHINLSRIADIVQWCVCHIEAANGQSTETPEKT